MPEGPEAHTMADKLKPVILGKYILSISFNEHSKQTGVNTIPLPSRVVDVIAHGKRPIIVLETGYLVAYLSMTGKWSFKKLEYSNTSLTMGSYDGLFSIEEMVIHFDDRLRWGHLTYLDKQSDINTYFEEIGRDLITNPPTLAEYKAVLGTVSPKWDMCKFLLEQRYFSGVGNYLKSEILYYAGIKPDRLVGSLTDVEIEKLYQCSISVIKLAYSYGGFTLKDYLSPDGAPGNYPHAVYERDKIGDPLGRQVLCTVFSGKRKTYWVPSVQI